MAWWGTNYVLGGFLATAFATWAVSRQAPLPQFGWSRGFLFPAVILALIIPLFFLVVTDAPPNSDAAAGEEDSHPAVPEHTSWTDLRALLCKPSLWMIGISYFFLELCRYALMFWLPYYMVRTLHYEVQTAGYLSSLYELIGIGGALFAGYVSDRCNQSRRAPVTVAMLGGLGVVMLFQPALAHTGLVGMGIAISLAGFLSYGPDTLLSGAAAQDVGETRAAATASGLIDGIGHLGAIVSPYLVILVSEHYGWDRLFLIFAGTALAAGLVLLPLWNLKPTHQNAKRLDEPVMQEAF